MRQILPLLMLAGCSAEPSPAAPSPTAAASEVAAIPPQPAAPPAGIASRAKPGTLQTFGDWTVGCDNTALCTMASLGPDGTFPDVTMALLRQPGPGGAYDLSFETVQDGDAVMPAAATIDGKRIALPSLNGAPAAAVAQAMAQGRELTLLGAKDQSQAVLSLAGASAALRWIDAQQGRAGTVTAAVAKGERPATTVPTPPDAPVIRAVRPSGTPAAPTPAQLARMRALARCEDEGAASNAPEAHALGDAATLVLLPCSSGAYNLSSTVFVLRGGAVEPAQLDAPSGFVEADRAGRLANVVNGDWRDGVLSSFAKGRGLGDCGVRQQFVWDGERLRLSDQAAMGDCRGNPSFITTWRAQVVRR